MTATPSRKKPRRRHEPKAAAPPPKLGRIERALAHAGSFAEWHALAAEHDRVSGADQRRADDGAALLHAAEIRRSIARLRELRAAGEWRALAERATEALYRHQGEFTHPELYQVARCGTYHVVGDFLDEIEACVRALVDAEIEGVGDEFKLEQVKRVGRVYGRPALLLSGGALLGLYHFGVVKALFEQQLLPRTISGSSMGSLLAAWTCCRTDDELRELFADTSLIERDALHLLPMREVLRQRTVMDQAKLLAFLGRVLPDLTFSEARRRSNRILNVTVSPVRTLQTPRLLNHLSAPRALVHHAVLASCAVPLVFKPVQLMARRDGEVVPWMENERWVDGSVSGDLPVAALTQMFNINHYITSQANPHVVPFLWMQDKRGGLMASIARAGTNLTLRGAAELLDFARRHAPGAPARQALDTAHAVADQSYAGSDMHIQLPFRPALYAKVMSNPSYKEFREYVRLGEQATWPQLPMIRDRTRLSRLFGTCIGVLRQRIAERAKAPLRSGASRARRS
jgi:NTE family protein